MSRILIVDDDEVFCTQLSLYIKRIGPACDIAGTLKDGLTKAGKNSYDIVFLDRVLPDASGLDGIAGFKETASQPEIIIITGEGDPDGAAMALQNGAWYFLEKPPAFDTISLLVNRALEYRRQKLQFAERKVLQRDYIIGNSPKLLESLALAAKATESDGSVLITGETGTGKELFARVIHQNSGRANKPFITIDCTNIPPTLAESLLFGHVKGAFTGADQEREGLIAQVEGGTLHIDEVGDLPAAVQKSFLRVLQEKSFRPLGAKKEVACSFRVIASTNKDIKSMVQEGPFRQDLYFRLAAFQVHLPPLRDRREDIKLLVNHFVYKICEESGAGTKGVSKDFMDCLMQYDWPGNVRELINVLQTSIAEAINEQVLYPHHLPQTVRIDFYKKTTSHKQSSVAEDLRFELKQISGFEGFPTFQQFRTAASSVAESAYLDEVIKRAGNKAGEAARLSGVSRANLYRLLKKHKKSLDG